MGTSPAANLDRFTTSQKNINSAIFEYLHKFGFERAANQFQEEMLLEAQNSLQKSFVSDEQSCIQQMGQAFNSGKREHFFILWNRHVPILIRQEDIICQKLEFYLQIYFSVYPAFMSDAGPA